MKVETLYIFNYQFSFVCALSVGEYFEPFYLELEFKGDGIEVSFH